MPGRAGRLPQHGQEGAAAEVGEAADRDLVLLGAADRVARALVEVPRQRKRPRLEPLQGGGKALHGVADDEKNLGKFFEETRLRGRRESQL